MALDFTILKKPPQAILACGGCILLEFVFQDEAS